MSYLKILGLNQALGANSKNDYLVEFSQIRSTWAVDNPRFPGIGAEVKTMQKIGYHLKMCLENCNKRCLQLAIPLEQIHGRCDVNHYILSNGFV